MRLSRRRSLCPGADPKPVAEFGGNMVIRDEYFVDVARYWFPELYLPGPLKKGQLCGVVRQSSMREFEEQAREKASLEKVKRQPPRWSQKLSPCGP